MINDKLKKIVDYLPALSILLIFIGYCHLHFFYYYQFNIDIYQYISTSEIILSFLPIINWIFLLVVFIGFLIIITSGETKKEENTGRERIIYRIPFTSFQIDMGYPHRLATYWKILNQERDFSFKQKVFIWFKIIVHQVTFLTSFIIYMSYVVFTSDLHEDRDVLVFIVLIWILIIFFSLKRKFYLATYSILKNYYKEFYWICLFILGFLLIDFTISAQKGNEIKSRKGRPAIYFKSETSTVNTFSDTSLSYIGSTQEYIFIYSHLLNSNFIYRKSEINQLMIGYRKIKSKKNTNIENKPKNQQPQRAETDTINNKKSDTLNEN